jgi:FixJ family two-component response regulator
LVTDLQMPGRLDGSEVAAAMKKQRPHIPIVIVSGRPDLFQVSWRSEFGYGLLSKPFRTGQLVRLLQQPMHAHECLTFMAACKQVGISGRCNGTIPGPG